jgi:hypothetical protein
MLSISHWVHLVRRPLIGLLYQPRVIVDDECGAIGGMRIGRGNRSTRRKLVSVPLCPPLIPHDLSWARTRTATVGSLRLTASAMAWPIGPYLLVNIRMELSGYDLRTRSYEEREYVFMEFCSWFLYRPTGLELKCGVVWKERESGKQLLHMFYSHAMCIQQSTV